MFTVGIFTTHIPYLVFIACYAWFLIFGIEKVENGSIKITENSVQIEYHINHAKASPVSVYHYFELANSKSSELKKCKILTTRQKWKTNHIPYTKQDCYLENSFCRPPPALA